MSKKINTLFGAAALVAGTAFVTTTVTGQDGHDGMPEMSPEEMAIMQAWQECMTPNEHHTEMAKYAGNWEMTTRMWMDPAAPPQESNNKVVIEPIMGGRFLLEHVHGEPDGMMPGMTFEGMNISGYDNHKGKYTFAWIDNMSTGIFSGEGSANADGSVITYMGEAPDFLNPGAMKPVKSVVKHEGLNKIVFEMHEVNESGQWWKSFEGVYTRGGSMAKPKGMDNMKKGH